MKTLPGGLGTVRWTFLQELGFIKTIFSTIYYLLAYPRFAVRITDKNQTWRHMAVTPVFGRLRRGLNWIWGQSWPQNHGLYIVTSEPLQLRAQRVMKWNYFTITKAPCPQLAPGRNLLVLRTLKGAGALLRTILTWNVGFPQSAQEHSPVEERVTVIAKMDTNPEARKNWEK